MGTTRHCLLIAALLAFSVHAGEAEKIANMTRACGTPMGQGLCRVMNTAVQASACKTEACRLAVFRQRYPNGILVAGAGRFTADEYFRYMDAGEKMCELIAADCGKDFNGRGCRMARALWRQN
jgi:hypothetical protein